MALARIFSRYPEQTAALSQQLQQQGYTVEVLSPDEAPTTLADLEIQLEVCDPAVVLRRAAELASQLHGDIAIAPGALPASPREVAGEESGAAADAAAAPEFAATLAESAIPTAPEIHSEPAAQEVKPNRLARVGRASGAALAALAAGAGELLVSARAAFRECLERARALAAEAGARRQERLLELTRRRAEARQHAVALENSRRTLDAYLLQLQREHSDVLPDAGSKPAPVAEALLRASAKMRRIHITKWEAVLAGMVSATALFVAGLAVASFHSHPALSANRGVTLQSGGVTLQGPQAKPAAPARPSPAVRKPTPKAAAKPRPMRRTVSQRNLPQRNQDLVARDVVVRHFAAPKPTPPPQTSGWKHFSDESN